MYLLHSSSVSEKFINLESSEEVIELDANDVSYAGDMLFRADINCALVHVRVRCV